MIKFQTKKVIDVNDFDDLVQKTYGKPYSFQQQDGCKERQIVHISVPSKYIEDDQMHDSIPETVNGNVRGVKFKVWLDRDPKTQLKNDKCTDDWYINLFWERIFYPDVNTLINDLYAKGLIEAGEYSIDIDW